MLPMIQSLEKRMFMSVSAGTLASDVATLNTDAKAVLAARTALVAAGNADVKTIAADLKAINAHASLAVKLAALHQLAQTRSDLAVSHHFVALETSAFLILARSQALSGEIHGKGLLAHPSSATFLARVAKDISKLNSYPAAKYATMRNEFSSGTYYFNRNTGVIETSNPSLAGDIASTEADYSAKTDALSTAVSNVVTDATALATDLSAIQSG